MDAKQERPNVLMLVVHDIGTSLGCHGCPDINSPRLDRFAGEGVRFDGTREPRVESPAVEYD